MDKSGNFNLLDIFPVSNDTCKFSKEENVWQCSEYNESTDTSSGFI